MAYCDKSCVHDTVNMLPLERMMRNMAVAPRRCALSTHTAGNASHETRGRDIAIDSREYNTVYCISANRVDCDDVSIRVERVWATVSDRIVGRV